MFSLPYLAIICLNLHVSSGGFLAPPTESFVKKLDFSFVDPMIKPFFGLRSLYNPNPGPGSNLFPKTNPSLECNTLPEYAPQDIMTLQNNPESQSIFANMPSVTLFTETFLEKVDKTDILREAFDLSQTTANQYGDFVKWYTEKVLLNIGVDETTAAIIGEFAARAINPNFDVLTLRIVSRAYANMVANFLFVDGDLEKGNAEYLALLYAQSIIEYAKVTLDSDPTSKFFALANGFVDFFISLGLFTTTKAPIIGYYVGNEWFLAAVNYKCL